MRLSMAGSRATGSALRRPTACLMLKKERERGKVRKVRKVRRV